MTTHSNGMSALQLQDQLGVTYKTAWLLTQKLPRSMVDPDREPLEGVVEVDQAEIAFREGDTNQAKPPRKHAKYLRHAFRSHSPRDDFRQFLRLDRSLRKRQRETWSHAAHRRPQILSGADRLSA